MTRIRSLEQVVRQYDADSRWNESLTPDSYRGVIANVRVKIDRISHKQSWRVAIWPSGEYTGTIVGNLTDVKKFLNHHVPLPEDEPTDTAGTV